MITTKKDFFEAIAHIPNPVLHTGTEPGGYINMWFVVKDKTDYKIRGVELKGCRLIRPGIDANERYRVREASLIEKYSRWLHEYTKRMA